MTTVLASAAAAACAPFTSSASLAQKAPVGPAPGAKVTWNGGVYETLLTPRESGGAVKDAFHRAHAALHEQYGHWPIFEHCLPFDVARLWDEQRQARALLRFGDRDAIIQRARQEERLSRAA